MSGVTTGLRERGTVKMWNDSAGFGFIKQDRPGKDVFVHFRALHATGLQKLSVGDVVDYEVAEGPRGIRAENVRVLTRAAAAA